MAESGPAITKKSPDGFTLIEVMVAYLLLAVGLLGAAYLQTLSMQYGQQSDTRTHVNLIVGEMIERMRSNGVSVRTPAGLANPDTTSYTDTLDNTEIGSILPRGTVCPADPTTPRGQTICFMRDLITHVPFGNMQIVTVDLDSNSGDDHYRVTVFWSDRQLAVGGDQANRIFQADCTGPNRVWSTPPTPLTSLPAPTWWSPAYPDPGLCLTSQTWTFDVQPGQ